MKALVLSGGAGTRLRPITYTSAKQLVPIANKPILFYVLEDIAEAGITDVGMVIGHTGAEVRRAVGDGSRWGINVTYIEQDKPAGLAHAVKVSRAFLGDDDFVMYLGDNLLRTGIAGQTKKFVEARGRALDANDASKLPAAQILLARVPDPQRFGVVALNDDGSVNYLVEKPADPPSDLALVGVYWFDARVHDAIDALAPSARGELEITEAIQGLIDQGLPVRAEVVDGYWKDLGELDALLEGNRFVLELLQENNQATVDAESRIEGRVEICEGTVVEKSTIRGPVAIGKNVVIRNAYIGPYTAIADGCHVIEAEIEHSMVLSDSHIVGVGRIEDSLIGKDVELMRSERKPRAMRLMVGDHSRIDTSWG